VWCPDDGEKREDTRRIHAIDAQQAAEKWAEIEDCGGDYDIVRGDEKLVHVSLEGSDVVRIFLVSGEATPVYQAREQKLDRAEEV
jgi:hypothetical protein